VRCAEGHQAQFPRIVAGYYCVDHCGFNHCGFDFGILGFHGAIVVSCAIEIAYGGEVGVAGADLIETPGFFGHAVGEEGFVGVDGGEIGHHTCDEGIEVFAFFGRHDEHLTGEAVAKGVVSDALFRLWRGESFVGFRPRSVSG